MSGGDLNKATGKYSSVSGGYKGEATGKWDSVSGGYENKATGTEAASVSGGLQNEAGGATRILVTSKHERLRASRFGATAAAINKVGAQGHGRTLTCLLAGEPVAALTYHLEDGAVLLVTTIAVLEDDAHSKETKLSRVLAGVLLCYLAIAAEKRGLPSRLGFAPPSTETALADRLSFRSAAPPSAYRAAGARYMQWNPPRKL